MKKLIPLFLSIILASQTIAQNTSGITGKADTSYSSSAALKSTLKSYPNIRLAEEKSSPEVIEKRGLTYCSFGDRELRIDAFIPASAPQQKTPAILIVHGGGWRSGNRAMHIPLAQRLAAAGYACFTVEYRLSTEALYPAAIYDLKAALRWIRQNAEKFNIDTKKIAALGFSAGGELATFAGVTNELKKFNEKGCSDKFSSKVQAIIDIDGTLSFVHPESGEGKDGKKPSAATYWFGYSKAENPELWKEASPLTYVGKHSPPILFLNSSVDRMHAGRDDFRKELARYKIYSEVHTFPDSPHGFCLFEPWFEPTVNYISNFMQKVF